MHDSVSIAELGGNGEHWASRRLLVADTEAVRVFDVIDQTWQSTITGSASNLGKLANVVFGHTANEVLVFSDFGVKVTIWSLLTSRGVEIRDPKYAVTCYDFRSKTGHLALLTRGAAQDIMMLLKPGSHEVLKSVDLGTVDAQAVQWSGDGNWIVVRDIASAGHKVQIYTADGHLFRTFAGAEVLNEIGLGVNCIDWNAAGTLMVGGYNGSVTVLSQNTVSV